MPPKKRKISAVSSAPADSKTQNEKGVKDAKSQNNTSPEEPAVKKDRGRGSTKAATPVTPTFGSTKTPAPSETPGARSRTTRASAKEPIPVTVATEDTFELSRVSSAHKTPGVSSRRSQITALEPTPMTPASEAMYGSTKASAPVETPGTRSKRTRASVKQSTLPAPVLADTSEPPRTSAKEAASATSACEGTSGPSKTAASGTQSKRTRASAKEPTSAIPVPEDTFGPPMTPVSSDTVGSRSKKTRGSAKESTPMASLSEDTSGSSGTPGTTEAHSRRARVLAKEPIPVLEDTPESSETPVHTETPGTRSRKTKSSAAKEKLVTREPDPASRRSSSRISKLTSASSGTEALKASEHVFKEPELTRSSSRMSQRSSIARDASKDPDTSKRSSRKIQQKVILSPERSKSQAAEELERTPSARETVAENPEIDEDECMDIPRKKSDEKPIRKYNLMAPRRAGPDPPKEVSSSEQKNEKTSFEFSKRGKEQSKHVKQATTSKPKSQPTMPSKKRKLSTASSTSSQKTKEDKSSTPTTPTPTLTMVTRGSSKRTSIVDRSRTQSTSSEVAKSETSSRKSRTSEPPVEEKKPDEPSVKKMKTEKPPTPPTASIHTKTTPTVERWMKTRFSTGKVTPKLKEPTPEAPKPMPSSRMKTQSKSEEKEVETTPNAAVNLDSRSLRNRRVTISTVKIDSKPASSKASSEDPKSDAEEGGKFSRANKKPSREEENVPKADKSVEEPEKVEMKKALNAEAEEDVDELNTRSLRNRKLKNTTKATKVPKGASRDGSEEPKTDAQVSLKSSPRKTFSEETVEETEIQEVPEAEGDEKPSASPSRSVRSRISSVKSNSNLKSGNSNHRYDSGGLKSGVEERAKSFEAFSKKESAPNEDAEEPEEMEMQEMPDAETEEPQMDPKVDPEAAEPNAEDVPQAEAHDDHEEADHDPNAIQDQVQLDGAIQEEPENVLSNHTHHLEEVENGFAHNCEAMEEKGSSQKSENGEYLGSDEQNGDIAPMEVDEEAAIPSPEAHEVTPESTIVGAATEANGHSETTIVGASTAQATAALRSPVQELNAEEIPKLVIVEDTPEALTPPTPAQANEQPATAAPAPPAASSADDSDDDVVLLEDRPIYSVVGVEDFQARPYILDRTPQRPEPAPCQAAAAAAAINSHGRLLSPTRIPAEPSTDIIRPNIEGENSYSEYSSVYPPRPLSNEPSAAAIESSARFLRPEQIPGSAANRSAPGTARRRSIEELPDDVPQNVIISGPPSNPIEIARPADVPPVAEEGVHNSSTSSDDDIPELFIMAGIMQRKKPKNRRNEDEAGPSVPQESVRAPRKSRVVGDDSDDEVLFIEEIEAPLKAEAVRSIRQTPCGKHEFLVKWEGEDENKNTWEEEVDPHLVLAYEKLKSMKKVHRMIHLKKQMLAKRVPERIINEVKDDNGTRRFLVKNKGSKNLDLAPASEIFNKNPHLVFKYYEQKLPGRRRYDNFFS
ncbi:hypothetical protein L596_001080 [Steinernema carpocapsae]|uniref:Chromo domain-containing protein n=1 Tax=Steinernema carpocapsae TaxID=34508 RepID=A0A4U8UKQ7_STECR|nr:hypothetical protein L596_001080 [Steinernema carpocapsae]